MEKTPFIPLCAFLILLAGTRSVRADEVETVFEAIPTSVSGTFKPFALAVDGKKLLRDSRTLKKLEVNGKEVLPEKQKQLPFFVRSEQERLDIKATFIDDKSENWTFELPRLELDSATTQIVVFNAYGVANDVLVDGTRLGLRNGSARWQLPPGKTAFVKSRVVEISAGKSRPGRLYNLKLIGNFGDRSPASVAQVPKLSLVSFRLSQFSVFQSGGRNSFSGFISWSPSVGLGPYFRIGASAGGSTLKAISGVNFWVWAAEGYLAWRPGSFGVELGGGVQSWVSNGGTRPLASVTLNNFFQKPWLDVLDRLFLSYSYFMSTPDPSHQVRLGIGLSF